LSRRRRKSRDQEPVGIDGLPAEFRSGMATLLGEEAGAFFEALVREASGLRINTLRETPERARARLPFQATPIPGVPEGFLLDAGERAGRHPYHQAGLYYLQDPSAMVVGRLVNPRGGERVADLAGAPGGKAAHLAALMGDTGYLLANDPHAGRARELAGNLERLGVRNAVVTMESVERIADHFGDWFHRVLLDAPCSGEAMFLKSAAARAGWSESAVEGCARRQEDLLASAARLVMPGGLMVYSTCTFSPREDEQVIDHFLRRHPEFRMESAPPHPGAAPGRPDWLGGEAGAAGLERAVRLWPHLVPGAGHFIALLRRSGDAPPSSPVATPLQGVAAQGSMPHESLARDWLDANLGLADPGELIVRRDEFFAGPVTAPDLGGLRVLRPGWWLGTRQGDRFVPAHALAMGLRNTEAGATLDLAADDPRTAAFLRGETVPDAGDPGWLVVRVDGYPLGWGKRVGGTVKNHLPKGLRATW
jgi:16S rRNA C967 or C1407 C5-methylase (RsmB/RsmF family)/NOL1/NOP2/fmu family ribosome biogenesis protein